MSKSSSDRQLAIDSISPGDPLIPLSRPTDPIGVVLFCAAIRNFHRLHYDAAYARDQGLGGIIVPGFLLGNWCIEAVTHSFRTPVRIRKLAFRNARTAMVGETFTVRGAVDAVDLTPSGDRSASCGVEVVSPAGDIVTTATVLVSPRSH